MNGICANCKYCIIEFGEDEDRLICSHTQKYTNKNYNYNKWEHDFDYSGKSKEDNKLF